MGGGGRTFERAHSNYFFNIFSMAGNNKEKIVCTVQPKVTEEMNDVLCAEYRDEVNRASDSISVFKAPGSDGMPAIFFKRFWQTVGNQVTQELLRILRGEMPDGWNDTLSANSKACQPVSIKDLRPVSLCNGIS